MEMDVGTQVIFKLGKDGRPDIAIAPLERPKKQRVETSLRAWIKAKGTKGLKYQVFTVESKPMTLVTREVDEVVETGSETMGETGGEHET